MSSPQEKNISTKAKRRRKLNLDDNDIDFILLSTILNKYNVSAILNSDLADKIPIGKRILQDDGSYKDIYNINKSLISRLLEIMAAINTYNQQILIVYKCLHTASNMQPLDTSDKITSTLANFANKNNTKYLEKKNNDASNTLLPKYRAPKFNDFIHLISQYYDIDLSSIPIQKLVGFFEELKRFGCSDLLKIFRMNFKEIPETTIQKLFFQLQIDSLKKGISGKFVNNNDVLIYHSTEPKNQTCPLKQMLVLPSLQFNIDRSISHLQQFIHDNISSGVINLIDNFDSDEESMTQTKLFGGKNKKGKTKIKNKKSKKNRKKKKTKKK